MHTLKSKSLIGCAQTGSGKTACFALPILQGLARDPFGVFALVLAPSRELCYQINEQLKSFAGANLNLRTSVLVGGVDYLRQGRELQEIPHVIIACPGRLLHFLENDQYQLVDYLQNLQVLVFDEADRLLGEETMRPDLERILAKLPRQRQTLLFSATMLKNYADKLSKSLVFGEEGAEVVEVGNRASTEF